MEKETKERVVLQWHPAFFAGIQIEFEQEADKLLFENEHQLGTKPKEIDVLIIKKNPQDKINKNIGRIFKEHNIIEYKGPDDYLSIDDFYKVYGYACFYKSDTSKINEIKVENITISFVCHSYPRKLIKHLKYERKFSVVKQEKGIYYIVGDIICMQLVISSKLSKENNFWLSNLTNNLQEQETAEKLLLEYKKNKENNLYKSVMDIIVRANKDKFEEVKTMCDALLELMEDELNEMSEKVRAKAIAEGREEGREEGRAEGRAEIIRECLKRNKDCKSVAEFLGLSLEIVEEIASESKE